MNPPRRYVSDRVGDLPPDSGIIPGTSKESHLDGSKLLPENDHDLAMEWWKEETSFVGVSFGYRVHCRKCKMTTMRHWSMEEPDPYDAMAHALRLVARYGASCADVPKIVDILGVQES